MSKLCRLRNASHGDDGQWAYSEIVGLREQVKFWQKEAAGRREDMANYTRIVSETIDRLNVEVEKLTKERMLCAADVVRCADTWSMSVSIQGACASNSLLLPSRTRSRERFSNSHGKAFP